MLLITEELVNAAREFAELARAAGADEAMLRIAEESEFDFSISLFDSDGSVANLHANGYVAVSHEAD